VGLLAVGVEEDGELVRFGLCSGSYGGAVLECCAFAGARVTRLQCRVVVRDLPGHRLEPDIEIELGVGGRAIRGETRRVAVQADSDGRGWVRTSGLSRVRRALSH
jgi:hypothetical protein